jgi:drug/metabolite transporter (DMT)-like permease
MNSKPLSYQSLSPIAALSATMPAVLFGANAVAIKICLNGIGEFTTAGLRFGLASIVISCRIKYTGGILVVPRKHLLPLLTLCIIFLIQLALFYAGLGKTYASRTTLIINFTPFITLILAHFFIPGDQLTKRKIMGMISVVIFLMKG